MGIKKILIGYAFLFLLPAIYLYLIFNNGISFLVEHFFYSIYLLLILVHIKTLVFVLVKPKAVRVLLSIVAFITLNYFIIAYLLFYFGKIELSVPFTYNVVIPYIENYKELLNVISIPYYKLIIIIILYLIIVFVWQSVHLQVINGFLKDSSNLLKKIKLKFIILSLAFFIIFPLLLSQISIFYKRFETNKSRQPHLTQFFYENYFEKQKKIGIKNIHDKNQYSNNLNFNKKNIIIIVCDALRDNYFGFNGGEKNVSPFIDSLVLSKNYINVDNFYSTTSNSYNGVSSIFSSNYLLYRNNFFLYDLLKKQGYSINFILSGDLTNFSGMKKHLKTKSVDSYSDGYKNFKEGFTNNFNDDKKNVITKLNDINNYDGTPTFYYLHLMSTHQIGYLERKNKIFKPSEIDLSSRNHNNEKLQNNYKNRVHQLDGNINQIFSILENKGYMSNSIVVITSDHGQNLGENNLYWHGVNLTYENTKIPLIISNNYNFKIDTTSLKNQLDISPTILDMLKIPKPKSWQGNSIYKGKKEKYLFQYQNNEYSILWKENLITFRYYINKATKDEKLYKIIDGKINYTNIIHSIKKSRVNSLRELIYKKFNLK